MSVRIIQFAFIAITTLVLVSPLRAAQTTAFYYTYSTGSSSDYLPEYDIQLESSSYSVLRDLPALETPRLDEVDWATSASYAENYIVPYAVGDRLFVLRGWGSGSLDIQEYDPVTLDPIGLELYINNTDFLSYTSVVSVVMNPGIVYWYNSQTDPFFDSDSGWESYVIETGSRQFMNQGCSEFKPSEGDLYCFESFNDSGDLDFDGTIVEISKRDPVNGDTIADLGAWIFPDADSPSDWSFDVTDSTAYLARTNAGSIELWEFDLEAFELDPLAAAPILITGWAGGADPYDMDAEGDFVMLGIDDSDNTAVVYQRSTGSISIEQLAVSPSWPIMLVQEEPVAVTEDQDDAPNDNADSDSDADDSDVDSSEDSGSGGGAIPPGFIGLFAFVLVMRRKFRNLTANS
jgi:hypothetical protein